MAIERQISKDSASHKQQIKYYTERLKSVIEESNTYFND